MTSTDTSHMVCYRWFRIKLFVRGAHYRHIILRVANSLRGVLDYAIRRPRSGCFIFRMAVFDAFAERAYWSIDRRKKSIANSVGRG